jgi:hypothetical protein
MGLKKKILVLIELGRLFCFLIKNRFRRNQIPAISVEKTEAFVLGNGPSLKQSLPKLHPAPNRVFFCVNAFVCSPSFDVIRPEFYVLADVCYWTPFGNESNSAKQTAGQVVNAEVEAVLSSLLEKTKWPMVIFVPYADRKREVEKRLISNSNISIKYFHTNRFLDLPSPFRYWLARMNYMALGGQTVLTSAIFLAINSGISKVFVYGADHSMHLDLIVTQDNVVIADPAHFYKNATHLVPAASIRQSTGKLLSMSDWMYALGAMFEEHNDLKHYIETCGSQIFNATPNSFIDAYPRLPI